MAKQEIEKRRASLAELIDDLPHPWVIAVVQGAQEFKCERMLARLNITHYLPSKIVERRSGVRRTLRRHLSPVFPRYIFVCLHGHDFVLLDKVHVIQGVLRMQRKPVRMTLKELRFVARREISGDFDQLIPTAHGLHTGDRVSVAWETLTMEGVVARLVGSKKAVIDLATRRVTVAVAKITRL